ncbi:MAG: hypothetical protein IT330_00395 [Anaerolineae bacterium]|nr:hypothetical protein [Anaerolineae bacterium]
MAERIYLAKSRSFDKICSLRHNIIITDAKAVTEKSKRGKALQGGEATDCKPRRAESRRSSLLSRRLNAGYVTGQ